MTCLLCEPVQKSHRGTWRAYSCHLERDRDVHGIARVAIQAHHHQLPGWGPWCQGPLARYVEVARTPEQGNGAAHEWKQTQRMHRLHVRAGREPGNGDGEGHDTGQ